MKARAAQAASGAAARVDGLDVAKGAAIVLVVVGHIVARGTVPGADWYTQLKLLIYHFHMPLFMALSGMAMGLSWRRRDPAQLHAWVARRVARLLLPYLVFGVLIVAGKLLAMRFMHVDNPPASFLYGVVQLFLYPMASASVFLWFIQVLACYFLVFPYLLQWSARWAPWLVFVLALPLQAFQWSAVLNLAGIVEYLPFFAGGILLGQHWHRLAAHWLAPRMWPWYLLPFGAALLLLLSGTEVPKWLLGTLSLPFVLSVSQAVAGRLRVWLTYLGHRTLSIYLMNTLCIGLAKALLWSLLPWRDLYFLVYFVALAAAGLGLPLLVKASLQKYWPRGAAYI